MPRFPRIARPFDVHHREDSGREIVSVRGEIDLFTAPQLRSALEDVIWRSSLPVVVDLTETGSIDTHGLAAVLNAARRVESRDRSFVVACPGGGVRRLFAITGVDRQLRIVDDVAAAAA